MKVIDFLQPQRIVAHLAARTKAGVLSELSTHLAAQEPGVEAESLRKVLGYVSAVIVEPACVAIPVTGAMVDADGLVADETVIRQLVDSLQTLADACPP